MSTTTTPSLTFIGQQITIYGSLVLFVAGIVGSVVNIVVFISLRTFRQSTCAFYLTVMSFVNIGQLVLGLLSRIMIYGFAIDWTATSLFYCKFRLATFYYCSLLSYACLCLATIDQYFATCTHARWQQWSNIKVARRLLFFIAAIIILPLIPYPIFLNLVTSSTGKTACVTMNTIASQYRIYFVNLFLAGYATDCITFVFGFLAYRNVQQIAYRTVPLVRRELDKQLTIMVLVQVVINLITNIPAVTMNAIVFGTSDIKNPMFIEITQFVTTLSTVVYYSYFASPFYIYMCVSERFRRQCKHVTIGIFSKRWQQQYPAINQIEPTPATEPH